MFDLTFNKPPTSVSLDVASLVFLHLAEAIDVELLVFVSKRLHR